MTPPAHSENGSRHAFEPIAVIGVGAVLPDAPNAHAFWQNLVRGHCSVREVPSDLWDPAVYYSPDRSQREKTYSKIGTFVTGYEPDWRRLRIPPAALRQIDASQLWAIDASWQALADAGYDRKPFDRSRCAVVFGNSGGGEIRVANSLRIYFAHARHTLEQTRGFQDLTPERKGEVLKDWEQAFKRGLPELTEDSLPGELSNVIAGRVANLLDLSGKNLTADAACASSLAAVEIACRALQARECDLVLSGASDHFQEVSLYVKFCRIGALSANGSFPFDERADGFVMGEGCGVLLLKRLDDALREGDRIYAVIRGIGSSSDGRGKGITAPTQAGQTAAIRRALASAHATPSDMEYVECHGTGTVVGDAVEISALEEVFSSVEGRRIPIGSVKSNLGHLKSAAGIAALLKTILALHHEQIPPTLGITSPHPLLRRPEARLQAAVNLTPWLRGREGPPRRAGVSGFGFGGTNFHLVLEEAPATSVLGRQRVEAAVDPLIEAARQALVSAVGGPGPAVDAPLELEPAQRLAWLSQVRERCHLDATVPIPLNACESVATMARFLATLKTPVPGWPTPI